MTLDTGSQRSTRRSANLEIAASRRTKKIVAPFQLKIGRWHERLAVLRTAKMLDRGHAVDAEISELLPLIIAARIELEASVAETTDVAVTGHSLLAQVRATLTRLREDLEDLQSS